MKHRLQLYPTQRRKVLGTSEIVRKFCSHGGRCRPLNIYESGANKRKRIRRKRTAERKEAKVGKNRGKRRKGRQKKEINTHIHTQEKRNNHCWGFRFRDQRKRQEKKDVRLPVRNEWWKSEARKRMKAEREGESVAVSRVKLAPHSISPEGVSKRSPFPVPSALTVTARGIVDFGEYRPPATSLAVSPRRLIIKFGRIYPIPTIVP